MFGQDEANRSPSQQASEFSQSNLRLHASAFTSYGSYSTLTTSKSANLFFTLEHEKKNYYTVGYHWLSFSGDTIGKDYFTEFAFFGKGSRWLGGRVNASIFYAYNHQGEISNWTNPFIFHAFGVSVGYWLNADAAAGFTYSGAFQIQESKFSVFGNQSTKQTDYAVNNYSGHFSYNLGKGIWLATSAIATDSKWAGSLFFTRQNVSVSLGKYTRMNVSAGFGRRTFYFDEDLLLLYNQPEVQTGGYMLGGTIGITKNFNIAPSFEYDTFDSYNITYGSIGFRYSF
jgi:hypothetical protein